MKNEIINLSGLDIGIIVLYIVALFAIALWASYGKKNKTDSLFLAGKSLGWMAIGLTMWGTNVGPSMLIANASSGYESGMVAGNFSWMAFPFIMLLAFVFAPKYMGAGVSTLPEYIGKRFGARTRGYIAWYTIATTLISWLGLTLFSGGVFMAQILGMKLWVCITILVVVSALFAMAGGLKAIAYTNVFQMLLLIAVAIILVVLSLVKAGGMGTVVETVPPDYWNMFKPLSDPDFPWLALVIGYPVMGIWFWCTDQSMVQSVLGAKNMDQGRLGANLCAWLKVLDIPLFILPGILCLVLLPDLKNSTDAYLQLAQTVLPSGLLGLVVVVMLAALISTIGSALNSLSTIFTLDIMLRGKSGESISPERTKRMGRMVVLVGAVVSVFLAVAISFIQGLNFFNIFQSVLSFIAPPMAVTFLAAALWKKTSRRAIDLVLSAGTILSIGVGILYYCGLIFQGVHYMYISVGLFIFLILFVLIFSALDTKNVPAPMEIQDADIKVKPTVMIAWALLVVVMIALYIIFNGH